MNHYFQAGKYRLPLGGHTYVMGILNVTPDSFSDGGKWDSPQKAVEHALQMVAEGAEIIDIGGQSTRPGFQPVPPEEELRRIAPVLEALRGQVDLPLSVDTFYPQVAEEAVRLGADIVNDVTGFDHPRMVEVVAKTGCGCIVMHHNEIPQGDVAETMRRFFEQRIRTAVDQGVAPEAICLDIGIGFGLTLEQNLAAIRDLRRAGVDGFAMLVGASRKSFIGKVCVQPVASERVAGTVAAHVLSIAGGADIIRVHDVPEAVQSAQVADAILRSGKR